MTFLGGDVRIGDMFRGVGSAETSGGEPRNLNIGCFDRAVSGWVNTDITPHIFVAKIPGAARVLRLLGKMTDERYQQHRRGVFDEVDYVNLGRRFPYADESFDNVFSSHVLEHLYQDQAEHCVREVYRILKPGGVFRVTVPDLDVALRNYRPENPDELLRVAYNSGQERDKNRHHWMYNEHNLGALLRRAGFSEAVRCQFRQGRCPDLDRLDNRPDETLFMEGIK